MKRALYWICLAMVALVATFAQLDRQSRNSPKLAERIPMELGSFAAAHLTGHAIRAGNGNEALTRATQLVARRPVPAENLRLLAQARMLAGEEQAAALALQAAAHRGWRDDVTQRGMLELALAAGEPEEGARRLAAIWARARSADDLAEIAPLVLRDGNAQVEMARLLSANPRWKASFERLSPQVVKRRALANIVERAQAQGAEFDCKAFARAGVPC